MSGNYQYIPPEPTGSIDLEDVSINANGLGIIEEIISNSSAEIPHGRMDSPSVPNSGVLCGFSVVPAFLQGSPHPFVCLFHLSFKVCAIVTYWLMYTITQNIVLTFILTMIFLAVDFWTVKNVTGRILVGLRWWNDVKDDGASEWIFESSPSANLASIDRNIFWITLYIFPLYWIIAAISNILSFSPNFVILNIMGIVFGGTNALGYTKCWRLASPTARPDEWASGQAMHVLASAATDKILNTVNNSGVV